MLKPNSNNIILQVLIFITLVVGASVIYLELYNKNQIARSAFSFQINDLFLKDSLYNPISLDIQDNKPILVQNGGKWTVGQLDDYLGFYELLSDYLEAKSLNLRDVYDFYAIAIIQAYNNKEIQQYIEKSRKEESDPEYYEQFEKLAKKFLEINRKTKK